MTKPNNTVVSQTVQDGPNIAQRRTQGQDGGHGCVCGHAEFLHTSVGCLKWFLNCGCVAYEPDDGTDGYQPYWGQP